VKKKKKTNFFDYDVDTGRRGDPKHGWPEDRSFQLPIITADKILEVVLIEVMRTCQLE
jgi:hypothetical protein